MTSLSDAWQAVESSGSRLSQTTLRDLFAVASDGGEDRFSSFSIKFDDLLVDFSKEKLDATALGDLHRLARAAGVEAKRDAMFDGAAINATEGRAVLHTALRDPEGDFQALGEPVSGQVSAVLEAFLAFAEAVRDGRAAPPEGPFSDVVSIGIGGSDLGPAMATRALAPFHDGPRVHYVSNVDGAHLADTLTGLDPRRTLVIVQSKTFTTIETMTNAASARAWLVEAVGEEGLTGRMAAVSTNLEATAAFGIDPERVFGFWDWVGGRYSIWSAIGLPLAIAIGAGRFRKFLAGANAMDRHFCTAPFEANIPVTLGLLGIWRRNVMGCASTAVIPYDERLSRFPAYLQQLTMESNGKRVRLDGQSVTRPTCPVVWGEPGTNAQHSFFQLLHQGSDIVPVDFLLAAEPLAADAKHHSILAANCFAQAQALAFGKSEAEVRQDMRAAGASEETVERLVAHREFPGGRPSTTLLYRRLDPAALGRLIALYEHKTFVEAAIWDINAFDQWGVELGKVLAKLLQPMVEGAPVEGQDSSTAGLISAYRSLRGEGE